jgi:acyl dehydratase
VSQAPAPGGPLATYRVRAHNNATGMGNSIHDDDEARRHGYRGGLVPGVTTWAYLSHPLVEVLGPAFVERGSAEVRLVAPVYEGDEVEIEVAPAQRADSDAVQAVAQVAGTGVVATATAWLGEGVDPDGVGAGQRAPLPLPEERPPADETSLAPGRVLGTIPIAIAEADARAYLATVGESLPLFEERGAVHPGQLLQLANRALAANVALGPWVHVGSQLTNGALVRRDEPLEVRSQVRDRFERRGHQFVTLDVVVGRAGEGSGRGGSPDMACRVRHTAIYRLAPRTGE